MNVSGELVSVFEGCDSNIVAKLLLDDSNTKKARESETAIKEDREGGEYGTAAEKKEEKSCAKEVTKISLHFIFLIKLMTKS